MRHWNSIRTFKNEKQVSRKYINFFDMLYQKNPFYKTI